MKLSTVQREKHRNAAKQLIERLEHRLASAPPARAREPKFVERIGACKQQLSHGLRDGELVQLNVELSELFYRSSNADKRKRLPLTPR